LHHHLHIILSVCQTNVVEQYKSAKNLNGEQVIDLFSKYKIFDYLMSCFEALHTTGTNYIIDDIDLYIEARQAVV